jgi:hypothetical protein
VGSTGAGVSAAAAAGSAGFSAGFSVFLPLTVARSLANGDFGFSASSSLVAVGFSFLVNHGSELLRLSDLTAGVSAGLESPLVTGVSVVSVGTVAGDATDVASGSDASTAGMTGAVSLTGSASFAGTAGAASASGFFSTLCDENWF